MQGGAASDVWGCSALCFCRLCCQCHLCLGLCSGNRTVAGEASWLMWGTISVRDGSTRGGSNVPCAAVKTFTAVRLFAEPNRPQTWIVSPKLIVLTL